MLRSGGASRKWSSIARNPSRNSPNRAGPIAIINDSPIAESTEYRPPTQSQKPNMFSGSMAKDATLSAAVDTATK